VKRQAKEHCPRATQGAAPSLAQHPARDTQQVALESCWGERSAAPSCISQGKGARRISWLTPYAMATVLRKENTASSGPQKRQAVVSTLRTQLSPPIILYSLVDT
jgi:hypothetical protein